MKLSDKVDPNEAAAILGVSRPRLRQFVSSGQLQTAGKFGSSTVFLRSAIKELKTKRERAKKNGRGKSK